jgi:hypothetical protein
MPAPSTAIREFDAVDRARFEREILPAGQPAVLRGLVAGWPAVAAGCDSPEAICRYLVERDNGTPVDALLLAPEEKGRIFYNATMQGFNFARTRRTVSAVIEQIARYSAFDPAPAVAAQSAPIRASLPRFLDDNRMPLLDAAVEPRIWIGNAITVPAHFDDSQNIACVVAGRRRFTLLAPEQVENLYVGPVDFAPTGAPMSLVDFAAPDLARFPRFATAQAHMLTAELGAGDALFIPPLWWHHVQSLGACNVLVNYWWGGSASVDGDPLAGFNCLQHALLTLRQLPAPQRAAWSALFAHYVFGDVTASVAHIPAERRGVLAALDATQVAERKAALAEKLRR